mmetsp:Transcript_1753/g.5585  ORF Transcript_1753/g.5585 Transcript_1753/m.5585 type:complete len:260 (-) Transcript_1753:35-814(-)
MRPSSCTRRFLFAGRISSTEFMCPSAARHSSWTPAPIWASSRCSRSPSTHAHAFSRWSRLRTRSHSSSGTSSALPTCAACRRCCANGQGSTSSTVLVMHPPSRPATRGSGPHSALAWTRRSSAELPRRQQRQRRRRRRRRRRRWRRQRCELSPSRVCSRSSAWRGSTCSRWTARAMSSPCCAALVRATGLPSGRSSQRCTTSTAASTASLRCCAATALEASSASRSRAGRSRGTTWWCLRPCGYFTSLPLGTEREWRGG